MIDNKYPEIQTILKTIGSNKRIAVVLPKQANIDLVCSALALSSAISTIISETPKTVMVFGSESSSIPFLKDAPQVHSTLSSGTQLAIKVSNRNAKPSELRYEKSDDGLIIFVTPDKESQFKPGDVTVLPSAANFDLVIILGAANFEQLGNLYSDNTKLFFETPNINIDVNPSNEFFGTINFVQTTASSVSEVVTDIVEAIPEAIKNATVSTGLLAGIISQTSSFRDPKTTPQAMLKASRLIEAGAKQQEIVQHLFKTKPLPLLQLWGRALARLTAIPEKQILTAIITKTDLEKTDVGVDSLPVVVGDIVEMITGYSLVIVLAELPSGGVQIILAGLPFEDLSKLVTELKPKQDALVSHKHAALIGKYEYVSIHVDETLDKVQETINKIIETRNSVV